MGKPNKVQREAAAKSATEDAPKAGDNLPPFGLPMLDEIAPDRGTFEPKLADAMELQKDAIKLLRDLEGFTLKGDTSIYAQIMSHMAELMWRSTEGMGVKEGVKQEGDKTVEVRGIALSNLTPSGPVPKEDAWLELKAAFLEEVENASTETGVAFKDTLESPTLKSTLPKCYRAGILMCFGIAENKIFKKSPRPMLGTPAEADGTKFNPKKHAVAPAAPYNMLQPEIVYEAKGKKKEPIVKPNIDSYFTYMSADNADLLHDKVFSKNTVSSSIETDEKTGKLRRKKQQREATISSSSATPVEVHLGEGSTPEDVWQGMQAMTREMKTGEVKIPEEVQKQVCGIVQEMIESLDKQGVESLAGDLVNLQAAIEVQCESNGIATNCFQQAVERLEDIPNIFKLPEEERLPIMSIYKVLHEQIGKAAA
jgi:hypothetical protein